MQTTHEIRARFDASTITVYQAYSPAIADAALAAQRFVAPFSFERMTWVKPSFLWMMERCGWATKAGQERVLAISMHRPSFDALVARAVPTHFEAPLDRTPESWRARRDEASALVQWDPERDLRGNKLGTRTIQLGIGRALSRAYASEWIARIDDVTPVVKVLARLRRAGEWEVAARKLPTERSYVTAAPGASSP
ncbi:MAG: DUF4291 domain-containing protein [Myxococcaceae bacterium]|nr:DUF4291 domain-containing protein [Myxococcaceae bacterium]